ncbi:THO complex subunit 7 homolog [Watersipora subatra]|uniref:THO complex subunit 7 homolog n=1 Tax=Watersipora subatra TaxID=2589382 RepID=UPI00355BF678
MNVTEDEIVRRKLLVDGDGGGDDKRLVLLQKYVVDWCNDTTDTDVESDVKYEKLISSLCNIEYQAEKTWLVQQMATREQERYDRLHDEIGEKVQAANSQIENCKEELIKAKQIRKNKQEYDAWAQKVMEHPNREETANKLEREHEKLKEMEQTRVELDQKLEQRKKQFAVLLTAIQDLQDELEEESMEKDGDIVIDAC